MHDCQIRQEAKGFKNIFDFVLSLMSDSIRAEKTDLVVSKEPAPVRLRLAEPLLLVSTLDGGLHANDRETGVKKWTVTEEPPLLYTDIPPTSGREAMPHLVDTTIPAYIVEPSQHGQLYVVDPETSLLKVRPFHMSLIIMFAEITLFH